MAGVVSSDVDSALEAVLRRDRLIVAGALVIVIAVSWAYLLAGAGMGQLAVAMHPGPGAAPSGEPAGSTVLSPAAWTPGYAVLMFGMWWVMMVAMMLPSAAPAVLLFAIINRRQRDAGHPFVAAGVFVAGYLAAWTAFSLAAVSLQWTLQRLGILSPMLVATSSVFGGAMLSAAGLYQLTPLKRACLRQCRSPLAFLGDRWRPHPRGALLMGLEHGAYCVGCCWFLMGLLFVGGVMNLYWVAGLALFVAFEKTVPAGHWTGVAVGIGLLAAGTGLLVAAL